MAAPASTGSPRRHESKQHLSEEELRKMHAYWRAANYLSVGQIYLYANPLLQEPLKIEHIKPRLLGHWGCPNDPASGALCVRSSVAPAGVDWHRGRSGPQKGSLPRASRRASCAVPLRIDAVWIHDALVTLWTPVQP